MRNAFKFLFFTFCYVSIFSSCKKDVEPIKILRFEQDLFNPNTLKSKNHYINLQNKYGIFYQTFAQDMLNISEEESIYGYAPSLNQFVAFPTIKQLKHEVDSVFPSIEFIEKELADAMFIYKKEFPQKKAPTFLTFLSEFGYAHVNVDTISGIGLDMYLGQDYPLYPALEFPSFMVQKLRKEYIIPNTIKSFAIGQFENQLTDKRFLAMMLFEGKIRYFMKQILPQTNDTLVFGYSPLQLEWAKQNESMIWTHFIENKLLFNVDPGEYMRYFNDGPFTIATGVPQESAPAIGIFIGYKMIEKYMNEHSGIELQELMDNNNWDQLFKEIAYRP
jgi:hypothetical protein